eukprot:3616562-Rhodomonas_salina.1
MQNPVLPCTVLRKRYGISGTVWYRPRVYCYQVPRGESQAATVYVEVAIILRGGYAMSGADEGCMAIATPVSSYASATQCPVLT